MQTVREAIIQEALTWEGTPFHRGALLRGIGGDCCCVLWTIYQRHIGVVPWTPYSHPPGRYQALFSGEWEWHTKEELLLSALTAYMPALRPLAVAEAQPGDFVLTGYPGQPANHVAIVLPGQMVLHARADTRSKGATIMRERRHPALEKTIRAAYVLVLEDDT